LWFERPNDASEFKAYLPAFLEIAGQTRWKNRAVQLGNSALESPYLAKIISDYHWLELALSSQMILLEESGNVDSQRQTSRSLAALYFAGTLVEVHKRVSPAGRKVLEGRVRDAMNPNSGFAPLFLEMEIAAQLMADGFDTEFPDLEGCGQYDLGFSKGDTRGEVECKSLSFDAGRKIHRNDFYRFVDGISTALMDRAANGKNEVILVAVRDRMPSAMKLQNQLRSAAIRLISSLNGDRETSDWFTIDRIESAGLWGSTPLTNERELYRVYTEAFGENCNVAGPITENGSCFVVARSDRLDDHSKPILEAMQKAITQLTGSVPGFVAVQFDDLRPDDLRLTHLRDRMALLSNYLFHTRSTTHVAGVFFRAYDGLTATHLGLGSPAIAAWNPLFTKDGEKNLPFMNESSDWWQ